MKPLSFNTQNAFQLLSNLLDNTQYLFWVYDADDNLVFANSIFFKVTGLHESCIGKPLDIISTRPDVYTLIKTRLDATRKQQGTLQFTDSIADGNQQLNYESNWYTIKNDYGTFVAGHSINVTNKRKQSLAIKKLTSRVSYMSLASTDAIWEWEAGKKHLHINKRIAELTGYYTEVKHIGCSFWAAKVIDKDDRLFFLRKLIECIRSGKEILEIDYKIITKHGERKFISDKMYFIYQNKKLVKVFGSLKDVTYKRTLEKEIFVQQTEKETAIYTATVNAQEEERDRISKELHDNINQLMLSSKMYMSIAKKNPDTAAAMLDKAIEYQLMAIDESRKLSHKISNAAIECTGLKSIVGNVADTLKLAGLHVKTSVREEALELLTSAQTTMIARILQELSSNILKYAKASTVFISMHEEDGLIRLLLSDDGIGFNYNKASAGIGLSNIKNRVRALAGSLSFFTAPGEGCEVNISFSTQQKEVYQKIA
jgi:PAS domain S-box-containing protein